MLEDGSRLEKDRSWSLNSGQELDRVAARGKAAMGTACESGEAGMSGELGTTGMEKLLDLELGPIALKT